MKNSMRPVYVACTVVIGMALLIGCELPQKDQGKMDTGTAEVPKQVTKEAGVVSINTIPLGADVYLDGVHKGKTPTDLKLEEGKEYKLELKEEEHGYETETMMIKSTTGSVNVNMRKKR